MARILIVEDDSLVAMGMRIFLEACGHEVVDIAVSGEQAVSRTFDRDPDLVLMDVRLKGAMDGVDAAETILKERGGLPILFVSGSGEPQTLARIRAVNPAGLLLKPVTPTDLASGIERAMAGIGTGSQGL